MKINRKKSGIMFIKKRKDSQYQLRQEINGYPIVKIYKYLGIWFDERLTFDHHIAVIKEKIEKGLRLVDLMKWKKAST